MKRYKLILQGYFVKQWLRQELTRLKIMFNMDRRG